jgi:tripartite-type tricarboxylate transporter receptor subunit TctC
MTRKFLRSLGILATALVTAGSAFAQADAWPSKPITMIVPFPPGGTSDAMARLVADELRKSLGQAVIVDNKAGANGIIGTSAAAKAQPDGYTLLLSGVGSNAINHSLYAKVPYDETKDFVHITQFVSGPNVLVANPEFPAKTFKDFVAHVKANSGKLNYASSGNGASGHLSMEMLKQAAGLDIAHVPYKGGGPAISDVLGGQVPVMFLNQDNVLPHVKAGKLRALAVASEKRNPAYPDTPTIAESGFPGFFAVSWVGLSAPKGTPQPIVDRLHASVLKALNEPALKSRLQEAGWVVVASSPKEYTDFIRSEMDRWGKVIKAGNIRAD